MDMQGEKMSEPNTVREIFSADIRRAAHALTRAFRHEPIYQYVFQDAERYQRAAPLMFAILVRWAMLYRTAWATPEFDGVILCRPPGTYHPSPWTALRTGLVRFPFIFGTRAFKRLSAVLQILESKHDEIMGNRPHWYGQNIGVIPSRQRTGLASQLIEYALGRMAQADPSCYLETGSEKNVRIYQRHGFELSSEAVLPGKGLTLYFMTRLPEKS